MARPAAPRHASLLLLPTHGHALRLTSMLSLLRGHAGGSTLLTRKGRRTTAGTTPPPARRLLIRERRRSVAARTLTGRTLLPPGRTHPVLRVLGHVAVRSGRRSAVLRVTRRGSAAVLRHRHLTAVGSPRARGTSRAADAAGSAAGTSGGHAAVLGVAVGRPARGAGGSARHGHGAPGGEVPALLRLHGVAVSVSIVSSALSPSRSRSTFSWDAGSVISCQSCLGMHAKQERTSREIASDPTDFARFSSSLGTTIRSTSRPGLPISVQSCLRQIAMEDPASAAAEDHRPSQWPPRCSEP